MKFAPLISVLLAITCPSYSAEFPRQRIGSDHSVHFGQRLSEIESAVGKKATIPKSTRARPEQNRVLLVTGTTLDFDSDNLFRIGFERDFDFTKAVAPFPAAWKNLDEIHGFRIQSGMTRTEFMTYFKAWEARALKSGAIRVEGSRLLADGEYRMKYEEQFNMVSITFGPERPGDRGGTWGDAYAIRFASAYEVRKLGLKLEALFSISAFCDEFNTRARAQPEKKA